MQKPEKHRKNAETYHTVYHREAIPESQSRENDSQSYQQSEIPRIWILPKQRKMSYAGTPQVNQEDEKPSQRIDSKGKQVEQPGERRETQEIYDRVDKLLPVCGHEKADEGHGQMTPSQNPCGVMETMEESADEI